MKRMLTSALILGLFSMVGLIGCGEEASVQKQETISTPGGTTTTTSTKEVETSGSNPPAPTGTNPAGTP